MLNEILKIFVKKNQESLLTLFNIYLREYAFSERWKTAQLMILYKGNGKLINDPSSLRSLYLLDNLTKLMERLILTRFNKTFENWGGLTKRQFGFSSDRGFIQVIKEVLNISKSVTARAEREGRLCLLIILDIQNVFNPTP